MKLQIALAVASLSLAGAAGAASNPSPQGNAPASRDGDVVVVPTSNGAPQGVPASVARFGIGEAQRWAEIGHPAEISTDATHSTVKPASVTFSHGAAPAHK